MVFSTGTRLPGGEGKQALFILHHPIKITRQSAFKSHLLAGGGVFEGNRFGMKCQSLVAILGFSIFSITYNRMTLIS
jgi:hypothetical protein